MNPVLIIVGLARGLLFYNIPDDSSHLLPNPNPALCPRLSSQSMSSQSQQSQHSAQDRLLQKIQEYSNQPKTINQVLESPRLTDEFDEYNYSYSRAMDNEVTDYQRSEDGENQHHVWYEKEPIDAQVSQKAPPVVKFPQSRYFAAKPWWEESEDEEPVFDNNEESKGFDIRTQPLLKDTVETFKREDPEESKIKYEKNQKEDVTPALPQETSIKSKTSRLSPETIRQQQSGASQREMPSPKTKNVPFETHTQNEPRNDSSRHLTSKQEPSKHESSSSRDSSVQIPNPPKSKKFADSPPEYKNYHLTLSEIPRGSMFASNLIYSNPMFHPGLYDIRNRSPFDSTLMPDVETAPVQEF